MVNHRKSCIVAAAAAAAGLISDAGDVADVSVVGNSQMRLASEVVQVSDEIVTPWKHLARVAAEALCRQLVVDVGDQRVPVVTQVELDVGLAGVTFIDADQRVMTRI